MGKKSTFRLLNRGSAKALDKVAELYGIIYILHFLQLAYLSFFADGLPYEEITEVFFYITETGKEVLLVKTTIHDIMSKMIRVGKFISM